MMILESRLWQVAVASALAVVSPSLFGPASAQDVTITDLGALLPPEDWSFAIAVNDRGQVAGMAFDPETWGVYPVVWERDGDGIDVQVLGASDGDPQYEIPVLDEAGSQHGINGRGDVVGVRHPLVPGPGWRPVLWERGRDGTLPSAPLDLPLPEGQVPAWGYANAINDHGEIAGFGPFRDSSGAYRTGVLFWNANRQVQVLVPPEGLNAHARDLNDAGQILAVGYDEDYNSHALLWERTPDGHAVMELPAPAELVWVEPYAINNADQAVGLAWGGPDPFYGYPTYRVALMWERDRLGTWSVTRLEHPGCPLDYSAGAYSINDRGEVVGLSCQGWVVWTKDATGQHVPAVVPTPGFLGGGPQALNNRGQLVGFLSDGGWQHAGLWDRSVARHVGVDIKPGACSNPINLRSRGVVPVAVLGDPELAVADLDVESLRLEGVSPLRSALEDVSASPEDPNGAVCPRECLPASPDGIPDLVLHFDTTALARALGEVTDGECRRLELTGRMLDGTEIEGEDAVLVKTRR